ncbi:exodeoxyribonuclease VII large subunit [Derxia gummosa]|uniref:Exodeoxyribonuclease 7 large subunit n=1 Tax=Derxia gummosa DSM 723 TaxID=1121388 RepID=A0A8B6X1I2_9BURK|nr:exodeoxyribonuclease VII large subunit [Derxia gummosa]
MSGDQFASGSRGRESLSVSDLNRAVARCLESSFPLLSVRGELSNLTRAASGHWYFTLKDDAAQVRCAMFRGRAQFVDFQPRNGDAVELSAQVRLYEARGDYQLVVDSMRRAGAGGLLEAFMRLRDQLAREGLFAAERKRPWPEFVRRIGVVTSPDAAALRDVVVTFRRRAPQVSLVLYPTQVQGATAAAQIAAAIALANRRRERDGLDGLIVCRGGGSIEDLWSFNDEAVARAIAASELPVISGVGHQTDFTIADFVADIRAATPTAAAETAARPRDEWLQRVVAARDALAGRLERRIEQGEYRVDALTARLVSPAQRLDMAQQRLAALDHRRRAAMARRAEGAGRLLRDLGWALSTCRPALDVLDHRVERAAAALGAAGTAAFTTAEARLARLAAVLEAVGPRATLARGYAIVNREDGGVVSSSAALSPGDALRIEFADGRAEADVKRVERIPK